MSAQHRLIAARDRLERIGWEIDQKFTQPAANRHLSDLRTILYEIVGELMEIDRRLDQAEADARSASNVASCLANGIKPD